MRGLLIKSGIRQVIVLRILVLCFIFTANTSGAIAFVATQEKVDTLEAHRNYLHALESVNSKNYNKAIYYLRKAAIGYEYEQIWHRFFYTHNQISYLFAHQYKYQQSYQHLDSIGNKYAEHLTYASEAYVSFYKNMTWAHFQLYNYEEALGYFKLLDAAMAETQKPNAKDILFLNYYRGVIYQRIGQYDLALKYMLISKKICVENGIQDYLGFTYNNLGIIYRNLNEYERALEYYKLALANNKNVMSEVRLTPIYNNIGKLYYLLSEYDNALAELNHAISVLRSSTDQYYSVESALINSKALVLLEISDYDSAAIILHKVLAREIEKYGDKGLISSETFKSLGQLYAKTNDYEESNKYLEQAAKITSDNLGAKNDKVAEDYNLIGKNEINNQNYLDAASIFQNSIISLVPKFNDSDISKNPSVNSEILDKVLLIETLYLKAKALLSLYKNTQDNQYLMASASSNQTARHLVEWVRENLLYESSILNLSEKSKAIYEQSIEIALLKEDKGLENSAQQVFEAMENSKAYLLTEAVQKAKVLGYSSIPESTLAKEDSFRTIIKVLEAKRLNIIKRSKDSVALIEVNDILFTIKEGFEEYKLTKSGSNPKMMEKHIMPQIDDFKTSLDEKTLIIEYFAGNDVLYAIAISQDNVKIYELGEYKDIVEAYVLSLKEMRKLDAQAYQNISGELYTLVLEPILQDFSKVGSLVIIPDKQLGYIPFDALTIQKVSSPNYSTLKYLVNDYTILQHQSVGLFIDHTIDERQAILPFIGYAPDFKKSELPSLMASNRSSGESGTELKSLPFAKEEVNTIAKLLSGEVATDTMASEANFKKTAANYEILHIASHSIIDESNPLYSKLVFALQDSIAEEDGQLYSYEIYGMNLNCKLVTLSACNTGTGKYLEGEGIYSLGRGFLMAGAKSVLTSLWEVSDQSTSVIMESFYTNLHKGKTSPVALRKAKLEYLKNADPLTANPYYWAGFVYIGQPDTLYPSNRIYYWLGGFLLLIVSFWVIRYRLLLKAEV